MKLREQVVFWEARYNELLDQHEQLTEKYYKLVDEAMALKTKGYQVPELPKLPSQDRARKLSDEQIVKEAEDGFLAKATSDLIAQGVDPAVARQEALRIRKEVGVSTL